MKTPTREHANPPGSDEDDKLNTLAAQEAREKRTAAKSPTAQDFQDYGTTIANSVNAPSGYQSAIGTLISEFVEKDRLGEKPDADVLRKHIKAAAKLENLPAEIAAIPVP